MTMDFDAKCRHVLQSLVAHPKCHLSSLSTTPTAQGVYVWWWAAQQPVCLKVGIAGPRRGKGLRERIRLHYASSASNSVLARHLAADAVSPWSVGRDFTRREQRQDFLAKACYVQTLPLPGVSRTDLIRFESFFIRELKPIYVGRVRRPANTGLQPAGHPLPPADK
jgi:hypothetical protein